METNLAETPESAESAQVEATEVDSEVVETEGAESAPAAAEPGKPEPRDKIQERFDKLTREKYEGLSRAERAEYRAQELERRLAEIEAKTAPKETVAPSDEFPTLESVDFDENKLRQAIDDYYTRKADQRAEAALAKREQARQREQIEQDWQRKQAKFIESKPEYAEKVIEGAKRGAWALSGEALEVAQASEIGPEILLYLAENADKSREIFRLPVSLQAREIGRIEARLEAAKVAPPPVSKAPPPAPKVEGSASSSEEDPSKMTRLQYAKWREKHGG